MTPILAAYLVGLLVFEALTWIDRHPTYPVGKGGTQPSAWRDYGWPLIWPFAVVIALARRFGR